MQSQSSILCLSGGKEEESALDQRLEECCVCTGGRVAANLNGAAYRMQSILTSCAALHLMLVVSCTTDPWSQRIRVPTGLTSSHSLLHCCVHGKASHLHRACGRSLLPRESCVPAANHIPAHCAVLTIGNAGPDQGCQQRASHEDE